MKTFVRREGRITKGQQKALRTLSYKYGISSEPVLLNYEHLFKRVAPITLEIGFGNGQSLLSLGEACPDEDFIGIEVYRSGVAQLLLGLQKNDVNNIRVLCDDAVTILKDRIPDYSLSKIQLFFPDPWPKFRHHKRRIIQSDFVSLVSTKLQVNGLIHIATDWKHYADQMISVMETHPDFTNTVGLGQFALRPHERALTKFEKRGQRLGHDVWDIIYKKFK